MSVHSTHYDDPEEYERDLRFEYRKEQYEQDHGIVGDMPFYTDDADDPHWKCENCGHCMTFNARKPIIHFMTYIDDKGYVHNNPEKPVKENLIAMFSPLPEYTACNICKLTHNQVMDDDYCEDFIEIGDDE